MPAETRIHRHELRGRRIPAGRIAGDVTVRPEVEGVSPLADVGRINHGRFRRECFRQSRPNDSAGEKSQGRSKEPAA